MSEMNPGGRMSRFIALVIVLAALVPVSAYWYWIGSGPEIEPQQAWDMLGSTDSNAILVDVRTPDDYSESHLEGAVNWSYEEIMALKPGDSMPQAFDGKRLLFVCSGGILNALAARHLQDALEADVFFVRGGMQGWIASGNRPCGLALLIKDDSEAASSLPFRASSNFEQSALIVSGFVIKPVYMILSLAIIVLLRRSAAPDLVALRWGMVFFLCGELACQFNYLVFTHDSYLMEYLHGFGMVTGFGFTIYAALDGIDSRLIHLSEPGHKCSALNLCRLCVKYGDHPCRLKQLFYFLIPAFMVLSFIPFSSAPRVVSYNTSIWNSFYNFSHPVLYQIYEIRFCPAFAIVFFTISLLVLGLKKNDPLKWAKIFFAAGSGALSFGLFRLVLFALHVDTLVWFNFWEETTELLFVLGICCVLWFFRKSLFPEIRSPAV